ncbi:hypothetical protein BGX21_002836 [Mortierella sp. AD011]|nr:hypothetical protein BGX21_002836 [Mortierella sp. AD011]
MATLIGVGMRSNSLSPSAAAQSLESSTAILNAPMADSTLRVSNSTSCPNGFKLGNGEYLHFNSSAKLNETTLMPQRLSGLCQYFQTHSACSIISNVLVDDGTSTYSGVSQDPILAAIRLKPMS